MDMIEQLHISNFLTFEKLEVPRLGRINLIAGKNNVGKTAFLEVLRILTSNGENTVINNILNSRGLLKEGWNESFNALFNRNHLTQNNTNTYVFGMNDLKVIKLKDAQDSYIYKLQTDKKDIILKADISYRNPKDKAIYIPYQASFEKLSDLWENIVLTPKEDSVLEIIRNSVEKKLVRFDIGRNGIKVRLSDIYNPVPLQSLGDGLQRVLLIAISLASAQNKYLLIDEIEMGLHYSVLEKLWRMVFKYALEWNIQVFATTHSQDAINAFHYVASEEQAYKKEAMFIRLQKNRNQELEAIIYDDERLDDALELNIEIR